MRIPDGTVACNAINALAKHAARGDEDAKASLGEYMISGQVEHMRDFACSSLAEIVDESDAGRAPRFEHGLSERIFDDADL